MGDSRQVSLIWAQAVRRYEEITKKKLDDPALRNLKTVDGLLGAIDNENKVFDDFRKKKQGIFTALKYAILPIELVGDLAAGGAAMAFPPSSLIFGAVKYLLSAAKGVSAKYDAIVELMSTLKDFTTRLEVYAQQQISQGLYNKLADILTTLLEVFAISRHEIEKGRLLTFGKNFLLGSDDGKAAIVKLAKLIDSERGLVGAETLTQVKVANLAINRVDNKMLGLSEQIEHLSSVQEKALMQVEETQEKGHRDHVKGVLQPGTSADDKYGMINRSRVPNTGDWIRTEKYFRDWISNEKPIVFVSGTPGAGKSYIASNIISYLKQRYPQNVQHPSHISVGYYFFKDDNLKTRSFHQALRDVAFKIAQNDPLYAKHITLCVDGPDDILTLQSLWQKLFADFFIESESSDSSVCIVLDALDEALGEDRLAFFELAKDIRQGGRFRLLMLGRPHIAEEMDELMEMLSISTIHVSDLNNSDDILNYIKTSISKSTYLKRASKDLQEEIIRSLSAGAQGMFLWVDFMLKELLKKKDQGSMRKALNEAPRGLSKMIRHVLRGYSESMKQSPQYADDLNEMLAWVTCTQRPLKLIEMDNILKWRYPEGDGWIWLEGSLRRQFSSFFQLTREDGLTTADLQRAATLDDGIDAIEQSYNNEDGFNNIENMSDFDSDPQTTEITFNHASLGDFFRNEEEGQVSAEDCPAIGVYYHEARVLVLKRYLEMISCSSDSPKWPIAKRLWNCVTKSVINGLSKVDIARTSKADKQAIGLHLARILSNQSVIAKLAGTVSTAFYSSETLDLIITWLRDGDVQEGLPSDESIWYAEATAENNADIFLRLIKYTAKQWLQVGRWKPQVCSQLIAHFLNIRNGWPCLPIDSPEKLVETADWCGFTKDATWYRRLGMTFRELGYGDQAIEYFQKALDVNPEGWLSRHGMMITYVADGEYQKAIDLGNINIEIFESNPNLGNRLFYLHDIYERLGLCHERIGDSNSALIAYQKAFENKKRCNSCTRDVLAYLHKQERYEELISMLQSMDEKIPNKEYTRLTEAFMNNSDLEGDVVDWVSAAGRHTQKTSFILQAYGSAVAAARKERTAVQAANVEFNYGILQHTLGKDPQRAARTWERLINTYRGRESGDEISLILGISSEKLANYCLTQCMETGVSKEEILRYGKMIENLAMGKPLDLHNTTDGQKDSNFVTTSPIGLTLGHYYRLCGKEKEAMECYAVQVRESIEFMSDDDGVEDYLGTYYRLACVLTAIRDDGNALAVLYHQNIEADKEDDIENEDKDEVELKLDNPDIDQIGKIDGRPSENGEKDEDEDDGLLSISLDYSCEGCSKSISFDGSSFCRYCQDLKFCSFCETCIQKLKAGVCTPTNICSPKHDWLYVPPRPLDVRKRTSEHIRMLFVQGNWVSPGEFKNQLKQKWGIPDKP